ncbi:MAG: hypothetical protein PHV85_05325, partial [Desulfovibrionaceae bacterium]|nr:hypothetical protein [Desulfovibrionaceae bacterium]
PGPGRRAQDPDQSGTIQPGTARIESSSELFSARREFRAQNLVDSDPQTAWAEGVKGPGQGQWVRLEFAGPVFVSRVGLANGNQATGQFTRFNRVRRARLEFSAGRALEVELADQEDVQWFDCPRAATTFVRLVIESVYPAYLERFTMNTALSELVVELAPGQGQVAVLSAEPGPASAAPAGARDQALDVVRRFYIGLATLSDDFPEVYAAQIRDKEALLFDVFREIQKQRKVFELFRRAVVELDGLDIRVLGESPDRIQVRASGKYVIYFEDSYREIDEDTDFTLAPEEDGWKIIDMNEIAAEQGPVRE